MEAESMALAQRSVRRSPKGGTGGGVPCEMARLRADFPLLQTSCDGRPLVYLDNPATTQKPQEVIDAISRVYREAYATPHRSVYRLSEQATAAYEEARAKVQRFIGAPTPEEIVFTRGTTEAINLVAATFGEATVGAGDEILISEMEHHSNIVPWQLLCARKGATLRVIPVSDAGELDLGALSALLGNKTKLLSVVHVSNVLGTVNPVRRIVELAHARGVPVLVDGAQSVQHMPIDVQALECDFFAFSGHKVFGPSGIGALYGKAHHLAAMPPYQGGGGMIAQVDFAETTYAPPPTRFEAGTPHWVGAIGLGVALDYLTRIGLPAIEAYGRDLLAYGTARLGEIPRLRLIGNATERASILSFVIDGVHPHDLATILDSRHIAVRAGHHCAQPLMKRFGVPATTRASLALYNTREDIDALARGIHRAVEMFDACPISATYTKK